MTTTAPSPRPPASPRSGRSWLQFRLGSLIVVMVLCALGVTWWRQWKLSDELREIRDELKGKDTQLEMLLAVRQVVRALDMKNPEHRRLKTEVEEFEPLSDHVQRQRIQIGGSQFDVVVFRPRAPETIREDNKDVIAVLQREGQVVDYMVHNLGGSWRDTYIEQPSNDHTYAIVVYDIDSAFGVGDREPSKVRYAITPEGIGPAMWDSGTTVTDANDE